MKKLQILDTGIKPAQENMEIDHELLGNLKPGDNPILHLYDWKNPSLTYGYFLKPSNVLDLEKAKKWNLDLARRPTGGGVIFHVSDFAFSVLIPKDHHGYFDNTLSNYKFINDLVLLAYSKAFAKEFSLNLLQTEPKAPDIASSHFCMAKPTKYDIMIGDKKIVGAAQRKKREGFLHQGSIAIAIPKKELLEDVLLPDTKVLESMQQTTFTLLKDSWTNQDLAEVRQILKKQLITTFTEGT